MPVGEEPGSIPRRPRGRSASPPGQRLAWWTGPRSLVLFILATVLLLGGGRRWLQAVRARRATDRLGAPDVRPDEIEASAEHGRDGLLELFRLLSSAPVPEQRAAAGRALGRLWAGDQLIAEEEKAVVARSYAVDWKARRRYPRAIQAPIPIAVEFGVPLLDDPTARGIRPEDLEWTHRILGAERASLERFGTWTPGRQRVDFSIEPADFPTNGPHRLVLEARVRTLGLTSEWTLDLPHVPFSLEFDPRLEPAAILTMPDEARAAEIRRAVRLVPGDDGDDSAGFLDFGPDMSLRNPPAIVVETPLPCDLAHTLAIEVEGVAGTFTSGKVVLSGQGAGGGEGSASFPLAPPVGIPPDGLDRPGERRIRAHLTVDPDLGWADPLARSVWPGTIVTDWCPIRLLRR